MLLIELKWMWRTLSVAAGVALAGACSGDNDGATGPGGGALSGGSKLGRVNQDGSPEAIPTVAAASVAQAPTVAGCPSTDYLRLVNVGTARQLHAAIKSALPGDQIRLAPGTYSGHFRPTNRSGTSTASIVMCGPATAILKGSSGYTLGPRNADWWVFNGFTIQDGLKGIMSDSSHSNVYEFLEIWNIGGECVHLRTSSSHNTIRQNYIHHCGMRNRHGEALYFGSDAGNFPSLRISFDTANHNLAEHNRLEQTSADAVDFKAGTRGNVLQYNTMRENGDGTCSQNGQDCGAANAFAPVGGRPGSSIIQCNDIVPMPAFNGRMIQVYSGGGAGDGDYNIIRWNMEGSVWIHSSQSDNTLMDNTPTGYAASCPVP